MSVLSHKLVRDLLGNAGVLVTIVAIIAVGTGSYVGLGSAHRILEASRSAYYQDYHFADFWVDLKKAPEAAVSPIALWPGVAAIEMRVVFDVIIDLPGEVQPLTGRLMSMPNRGFEQVMNGICLIRGSGFSDDRNEEVILSEQFASKHRLKPGDRIEVLLNRKRESFVIVGTAISPEYVYMVRGEGDFVPDPAHFSVLYLKEDYARELLDFEGACNQVVGRLVADEAPDIDALLERISRTLDPYGVLATVPRERQASHRFLSDEMHGLGISALVMPTIFLIVAALVLNIVMNRLTERQRTIIGTLKATGYSNRQVILHFLGFGMVIGLVGGLAGDAVGLLMASGLLYIYQDFFQFPAFMFQVFPDLCLVGIVISMLFALAGVAKGARAVLDLAPAEAMRPKPPERGGAVFLERFPVLWQRLGFRTHMALRSLARNRTRTATGVVSSAIATSLILVTLVMTDSIFFLVDFEFAHVLHSDVDIGLRDERSVPALLEGRALPGVDEAEPMLALTCDLRHGERSRRLTITGLSANHRLTTPMQANLEPIAIPPEGLVFARKLAEVLDARVGDRLVLTPVRGRRNPITVQLASIVDSYIGLACYADLRYLGRLVGEATAINAVQLAVNPAQQPALFQTIKQLPNAQGLSVRYQIRANIESTFIKSLSISLSLMVLFAGVIAFGSVLNSSLIEIGERIRDVATFRVLGYRSGQVASVFFRQNLVVFFLGLVLALPLGYGLILLLARAYDTELFRMPVFWRARTVVLTALLAFLFVLIAQWFVYRRIRKLDWLEGIKVRE